MKTDDALCDGVSRAQSMTQNELPKVSVVMAVYNIGNRCILDSAIKSVLQQDFKEFEFLICDDASTDLTYQWLKEWAERDQRIRLFRNTYNQKAAAARNRCIQEAKGEYIAIMDADDQCSTNRLRVQVDFLENNPQVDFVGLKGERFVHIPGDLNKPYWFCQWPEKENFLMTLPFVHASILFRTSDLLAVNGYSTRKSAVRSEDYDMLMRLYAAGKRGANTRDAVYYIREDQAAFARRKYRYRITEVLVKFKGFYTMNLMPKGVVYAVKPLIVGLIPVRCVEHLKKIYYR